MQKALMEMNWQLHHVVSDITGATGMRIIRAIVGGKRDPEVLAAFRAVRCKPSMDTIKAAVGALTVRGDGDWPRFQDKDQGQAAQCPILRAVSYLSESNRDFHTGRDLIHRP